MAIDVKSYKKRVLNQKLNFNLVPFIDILFTVMIFLVVTSNFGADVSSDVTDVTSETGKPDVTDISGDADYYVMPVAGLTKVTVNGQDMSSLIRHSAIAIHAKVIDNGQITIRPGEIIIKTPSDVSVKDAVRSPK